MRTPLKIATVVALLIAGTSLAGCYRWGHPGHDGDRGHHDGGDRGRGY